jgi:hypothetical protein
MPGMNLPSDAKIVVNRLGEPVGDECFTVLIIRTPSIEVEARWDTARRSYLIWAMALHGDGQRSHVFAVREAPHGRGVLSIAVQLVRRGLPK